MRINLGSAVVCTAGLIAGNFVWQAINSHLWTIALERSFFQAAAVIIVLAVGGTVTAMSAD